MKNKVSIILLFLAVLVFFLTYFVIDTFGVLEIDRILFILKTSLDGGSQTNLGNSDSLVITYLVHYFMPTIIVFAIFYIIINIKLKYRLYITFYKHQNIDVFSILNKHNFLVSLIIFILTIIFSFYKLDFFNQIKKMNTTSSFIEDNYVNPSKVKLEFPEKKKNVIYLFLESMENSYKSVEDGGILEENIIPNLTAYQKEGIFFNNNGAGIQQVRGATFTAAGMSSQAAGLPFISPIDGNKYGTYGEFMPGAYTLGDVLEKNGYEQTLFIGSDAAFGGRDNFYKSHGNFNIKDYHYFNNNGLIPKDYSVWWGIEDSKLFNLAKDELKNISTSSKPFNFTILTTNSHFEDGFLEDGCKTKFNDHYKDAIYCNDLMIYDFIEWIKKQDFYKDTVIVITGDHLTMDRDFFNGIDKDYYRTQYNVILNSDYQKTDEYNHKDVFSMDMLPTTLGAMNVKIEGDKMGMGTNLFSKEKTLVERYGIKHIDNELYFRSPFYTNKILKLN